ncbi:MAG TPA: electron transfer flavoprotein subunit alpha/FixB family protein [Burkholderiales bacterium]
MSAGGVMVVAELAAGRPLSVSRELLGLARRIVAQTGGPVCAVCPGADEGIAAELVAHGADRVYAAGDAALADYDSDAWTACAAWAAGAADPRVVLAGHTTSGADLAPRLAFRLNAAAATGCVGVALDGDTLRFTRPCYGGNARETVSFNTRLAVATVRGGCCEALPRDETRRGDRVEIALDRAALRARVIERQRESGGDVRLEEARVVVAGGRGLNGPEGFAVLGQLARELHGALGASRVPCDLGWCPHSMQIGLTGKTVTPELYVAVGISGAGHHMAGCGNARNIIAINTDPDAAIYREARWGVVGDYRKVIPPLIAAIRALRAAERKE